MSYQYCDDPLLILPDPNPTVNLDGMLSDANWVRAFGVEIDGLAQTTVIQRLVDAHAEIVRLRAEVKRLRGIVAADMLETGSAGTGAA